MYLLLLGITIITGILFGKLLNKFKVPSVAGYIIAGLILGTSGFNLVTGEMLDKLTFLNNIALGIIAFNIGSGLEASVIKQLGKPIFIIALCEATGAFILVTFVMLLLKEDIPTALILGAISSATAPAATVMVLNECKAKGPLTSTLLGVVAMDDAICLMIYALASSIAKAFIGQNSVSLSKVIISPIIEIVFSLFVGLLFGIILVYFVKQAKNNIEMVTCIVGVLLLTVGLTTKLNLSTLLSTMALGITVSNVSTRRNTVFSKVKDFSPPIIVAFFTLAGSRLDISLLPKIGLIGLAYLIFRILGKVLGAFLGGAISKAPTVVRNNIGFGLLSQVGVAIGLAIVVGNDFPDTQMGSIVITILLATTIITEIIGPIMTKHAIIKANEANIK